MRISNQHWRIFAGCPSMTLSLLPSSNSIIFAEALACRYMGAGENLAYQAVCGSICPARLILGLGLS